MNQPQTKQILFLGYVILFMIGAIARLVVIQNYDAIDYDDTFSYLAATGHQQDYAQAVEDESQGYFGHWTSIQDWRTFIELDDHFIFGKIAEDLATEDIHPPLYFWILHLWTILFGTSAFAAALLNLVFTGLTLLLLWFLANDVFRTPQAAFLSLIIWWLLPEPIISIANARQYMLFGLLYTAYILVFSRVFILNFGQVTWRDFAIYYVITTLGLLTFFQFGIAIAIGGLLLLMTYQRRRYMPYIVFGMLTLAALLTFMLLFPNFLHAIENQQAIRQPFDLLGSATRFRSAFLRIFAFFFYWQASDFFRVLFLCIMIPLVWRGVKHRQILTMHLKTRVQPLKTYLLSIDTWQLPPKMLFSITLFFILTILILIVANILYITPRHSMAVSSDSLVSGYRYFVHIMPPFAILLADFIHKQSFTRQLILLSVIACFGAAAIIVTYQTQPSTTIQTHDYYVMSVTNNGHILQLADRLPPNAMLFADDVDHLEANQALWLDVLTQHGGLYIMTSWERGDTPIANLLESNTVSQRSQAEWWPWASDMIEVFSTEE